MFTHPDVMYHGTSSANRTSVQANGLLAGVSYVAQSGGFGVVFLSEKTDDYNPDSYIDIWEVDVRGLALEADGTTVPEDDTDNWWQFFGDIPPQRLKLVYPGKTVAREAPVTETPSFKAWFVGSKVVDAKGQPLFAVAVLIVLAVVYM